VEVRTSPQVDRLVSQTGGRLYVWTEPHRCCSGGITMLRTSAGAPKGRRFRMHEASAFDLWFEDGVDPPDELHLEVRGFRRKHVEAYWNGCIYRA